MFTNTFRNPTYMKLHCGDEENSVHVAVHDQGTVDKWMQQKRVTLWPNEIPELEEQQNINNVTVLLQEQPVPSAQYAKRHSLEDETEPRNFESDSNDLCTRN